MKKNSSYDEFYTTMQRNATKKMKLVVFGANGGVGKEVVAQALAAGHHVIGVVRNIETANHTPRLEIVEGNITDVDFIARVTANSDVVISTIGTTQYKQPVHIYSDATKALVAGMSAAKTTRLIVLSAGGATIEPNDPFLFRYIIKPILQYIFRYLYKDMLRMERILEASKLDWTILRLSYLVNGKATGKYRTAHNAAVRYGQSIHRADVAHYIVAHATDSQDYRQHVSIAN